MSRHNRQRTRRARLAESKLEPGRISLAMHRFERTGKFPSYTTPAERIKAARLMRQGYDWFAVKLNNL